MTLLALMPRSCSPVRAVRWISLTLRADCAARVAAADFVSVADAEFGNGGVAQFVRLAVVETLFHASPGHPHVKAVRVVIPSGRGVPGLDRWQAAELAGPYDERVSKHPSLLKIGQ